MAWGASGSSETVMAPSRIGHAVTPVGEAELDSDGYAGGTLTVESDGTHAQRQAEGRLQNPTSRMSSSAASSFSEPVIDAILVAMIYFLVYPEWAGVASCRDDFRDGLIRVVPGRLASLRTGGL